MAIYEDNELDVPFVYDGMTQFNRVNSYGRTSVIEPDAMASALNMDLNRTVARTRRGIEQLGGLPEILNPSGTVSGPIQGAGFLDVLTGTGLQRLLVVVNKLPCKWDGTTWSPLLSSYTPATGTQQVCMAALVDKLYLATAGKNLYSWDGVSFVDIGTGSGSLPPQFTLICKHTYRLFGAGLPNAGDTLQCSDILDPTVWMPLQNSSRVGGGESDPITALCSWTDYNLVVGKRNSIWLVNADPTQTPANWQMKQVTDVAGCVSHRSMCMVGNDVFWLSNDGVRSIEYTLQGLTQGVSEPISRPIQDVIDRINWTAAGGACARYWKNRYILSVPLDTSTTNNAVLVYNTITQSWSGTWTGWNASIFVPTFFGGAARLAMGRADGLVAQWMEYVPEVAEVGANFMDMGQPYASNATTRALTCNEAISPKKGFSAEVEFWQSTAQGTVSVILDGGAPQPFWDGATEGASGSVIDDPLPLTLGVLKFWRIARDLMAFGSWREIQFQFSTTAGKMQVRSLYLEAQIEKFQAEIN